MACRRRTCRSPCEHHAGDGPGSEQATKKRPLHEHGRRAYRMRAVTEERVAMTTKSISTIAALGLLSSVIAAGSASARDLTVVSWGGNYQDAQRKIYFKPFSKVTGKPVLDEAWDGGIGVLQSKVKAGKPAGTRYRSRPKNSRLAVPTACTRRSTGSKVGGKDEFIPRRSMIVVSAPSSGRPRSPMTATSSRRDRNPGRISGTSRSSRANAACARAPKYTLEFALMADGVPRTRSTRCWQPPRAYDAPSRSSTN